MPSESNQTTNNQERAHTEDVDKDRKSGAVSKSSGFADVFSNFFSSICSLGTKPEVSDMDSEDHEKDAAKEDEPSGLEGTMIAAAEEQLYSLTATDGVMGPTGKKKILYPDGGCYEGPVLKGVWHGKGKLTYSNGSVFEGDFVKDVRHGKGTFEGANGEFYEGDWVKGEPNGKGRMVFPTGESYEGDILAGGIFHGFGTYEWPDGRKYVGEWKQNRFHGKGKFWFEHGDTYEGEWSEDEMHGEGVKVESGVTYHVNYNRGFLSAYSRDGVLSHIVNEKVVLESRRAATHDSLLGLPAGDTRPWAKGIPQK